MSLLSSTQPKWRWDLKWFASLFLNPNSFVLLIYFRLLFSTLQMVIILSCMISIAVNFSTFLVIGKTSPITYQVLGHLKTCLVLAFGYIIVHDPFSWRNILGILVAMVGMILYSYYCATEGQQKAAEAAAQASQVCFIWAFCMFLCFFVLIMDYKNPLCD